MRFTSFLITLALISPAFGKTLPHLIFAEEKALKAFLSDTLVAEDLAKWTKKDENGQYVVTDKQVADVKRQACIFLRIKKCKIEIAPFNSRFKSEFGVDTMIVTHKPTGIRQLIHLTTGKRLEIPKEVDINNVWVQRMQSREGRAEILFVLTSDMKKANQKVYLIYSDKTEVYEYAKIEGSDTHRLWDEATGDKSLAYMPSTGTLFKGLNLENALGEYVPFKESVERSTSNVEKLK